MVGTKEVLIGREKKQIKFRLQKAFQDIISRAKEEDETISSTQINWCTGFAKRSYKSVFPSSGNITVVDSEVVNVNEILKSQGAKVFEVMNREVIWTR